MRARTHVQLTAGERVGAYEIGRLLACGETASVYECCHVALGRPAAIKILHRHLAGNEEAAGRFVREGRALSLIRYPHVVEIHDLGEHHGVPYLVMALVEGNALDEHLRQQHPMTLSEVADCILPIVGAVVAAHDAGIVYRDVKPRNVRVVYDHRGLPVPKVLDFGISKLTGDEQSGKLKEIGELLATASYMSPDQLRSAKLATVRSDVYSLGVILYQASAGRRPFDGDHPAELMRAIMNERVEPPSHFRPELPPEFDGVVLRAMRREPAERYVSARELGRSLAPFSSASDAWLGEFAPRSGHRIVTRTSGVEPRKRTSP
ncbi:MAG: serine/threonine protein kinase [Myxococcales bacterium]|nr:serine/threonine protein kinase [Myxococcales bacterium]